MRFSKKFHSNLAAAFISVLSQFRAKFNGFFRFGFGNPLTWLFYYCYSMSVSSVYFLFGLFQNYGVHWYLTATLYFEIWSIPVNFTLTKWFAKTTSKKSCVVCTVLYSTRVVVLIFFNDLYSMFFLPFQLWRTRFSDFGNNIRLLKKYREKNNRQFFKSKWKKSKTKELFVHIN